MDVQTLRWVEHLHGHAGWLTAVALVHPAIVLRRTDRLAPWAVGLSTAMTTLVCVAGSWLYVAYRERLKQGIFQSAASIGMLFERKEHLAFAALAFAWIGALAYVASSRVPKESRRTLRVLSHRAYVVAAIFAVVVASFGTAVAAYRTF